jgi:hypothetical protein
MVLPLLFVNLHFEASFPSVVIQGSVGYRGGRSAIHLSWELVGRWLLLVDGLVSFFLWFRVHY